MKTIQARYCFILSAARSGSTFSDILLGGHPEIASLGELSYLSSLLGLNGSCGCGKAIDKCGSWKKIFAEIQIEKKSIY